MFKRLNSSELLVAHYNKETIECSSSYLGTHVMDVGIVNRLYNTVSLL